MSTELNQIIQIITQFYSNSTHPTNQIQLQQQLSSIQQDVKSWDIIQPLLLNQDVNIRFFAASTLQIKISQHWSTLLPSLHEPIKQSILNWLTLSASQAYPKTGPAIAEERIVMRKLASALTSLSLRLPDWNDWLLEVMVRVGAGTTRGAVLQIIAVVIEQVARIELVGPKKIEYMTKLSSSISHVVTTLAESLSSTSATIDEINSSLSCFTSFLIAGRFTHTSLDSLYSLLLPHLNREETVINAATAIEELIEQSSGLSGASSVTRFMTRSRTEHLVVHWATTPTIRDIIDHAVRDEDTTFESLAIIKLLVALSEHFITFLFLSVPSSSTMQHLTLSSPPVIHLLHSLLAITTYPGHTTESYIINDFPSGVWLALQEECSDNGLVKGEGEGREGRRGKEHEWNVVEGVFEALANGLRKRAEWPDIHSWPKDVVDDFRNYRSTTLAEMIILPYYILRESMLASLVNLVSIQVQDQSSQSFEPLEGTLFTIYTLQEAVDTSPSLVYLFTPFLFSQLPSTPSTLTLRSTTLRLIGAYATWFATQPAACLAAVEFVIKGLSQEKSLASVAAKSLRSLCSTARKELRKYCASFVDVLSTLEGNVEETEFVKVLESVASVIQALPPQELIDPLLTLTTPIITKLTSALSIPSTAPPLVINQARELLIQQLAYLLALAKGLSDPEGDLIDLDLSLDENNTSFEIDQSRLILRDDRVIEMRNQLGIIAQGVMTNWSADSEVAQALFDYIRISTADAILSPLALEPYNLLDLTSSTLTISTSPVWLLTAAHLVTRMGRDRRDNELTPGDRAGIAALLQEGLQATLDKLCHLPVMMENPDVVQAFVAYCSAIIQTYPRVFILMANQLDRVIVFAEIGLVGLQESFSLKAIIDLLIAIIQQTRLASTAYSTILTPHLHALLSSLLTAIAGSIPRSHLTSLSELLHVCLLRLPTETKSILHEALARTEVEGVVRGRDAFERSVFVARTGKQVRSAVSDFASVCRGLDGTAYGAASLSIFD